jgi:hypothetical protein
MRFISSLLEKNMEPYKTRTKTTFPSGTFPCGIRNFTAFVPNAASQLHAAAVKFRGNSPHALSSHPGYRRAAAAREILGGPTRPEGDFKPHTANLLTRFKEREPPAANGPGRGIPCEVSLTWKKMEMSLIYEREREREREQEPCQVGRNRRYLLLFGTKYFS